ncbi:MAG: hypothetical protein A2X34_05115 [Elusimicrobia bacterium GWC2_51_8]|nr:MAG: hypothetical protein A2X33_04715 [Elusimicrobia bacterium GWA2_51_34]OGR58423.1 MAG: hypothetical protein A2X34_05115 [Elusimicrobia bacterium GWC2_51_8]OGR87427.1 MAG: hypothetical protein A2021_05580 [Elusimicrobia bacterium GWF2_52_66]HAF96106.1 hypothetical protein [Elusimicrobiota bacterium]HCE97468.1 hypothetical protein [Elusimicrobiota bacterium]
MDKEELETAVAGTLADSGFEITDFKESRHNGKPLLQFFVDRVTEGLAVSPDSGPEGPVSGGKAGRGVTLDDCGLLTEKIGAYLDMNNIIEGGYIIEVSSPGIDRVLRREKDFKKFSGSKVKVELKKPLNKARVYYGTLIGFENGQVLLSDDLKFNLEDIKEVRLNPDDGDIFKDK